MLDVIAQLSDFHVGGPHVGRGERLSEAVADNERFDVHAAATIDELLAP